MTKNFKFKFALVALAVIVAVSPVSGAAPDRVGGYDFSYDLAGDARVKPSQVFDNGKFTYFQFRPGEAIPAIFADTPQGAVFLVPEMDGPYVRVAAIASRFALKLGYGTGHVNYVGGARVAAGSRATTSAVAAAAPTVAAPPAPSIGANLPQPPAHAGAASPSGSAESNSAVGAYLPTAARGVAPAAPAPVPSPATLASAPPPRAVSAMPARLLAAAQPISGMPADVFKELPRPTLQRDSYATPLRGDLVEWTDTIQRSKDHALVFTHDSAKLSPTVLKALKAIVGAARPATKYEVVGRDDVGHKERTADLRAAAVASALVAAGAPRASISLRASSEVREAGKGRVEGVTLRVFDFAPPAPVQADTGHDEISAVLQQLRSGAISPAEAVVRIQRAAAGSGTARATVAPAQNAWAIKKSDENVQKLFERWSREQSEWSLVWDAAPAIPITGDARLVRPNLMEAVKYVVEQARQADHPIGATVYLGNKTIVIKKD